MKITDEYFRSLPPDTQLVLTAAANSYGPFTRMGLVRLFDNALSGLESTGILQRIEIDKVNAKYEPAKRRDKRSDRYILLPEVEDLVVSVFRKTI